MTLILRLFPRLFIASALFFCTTTSQAQKVESITQKEEESISADRPDQTEATYILPKNDFQISEGLLFSKDIFENQFLLRYGLFKNTEIRTTLTFGNYEDKFQLQPVQLSLKHRIISEEAGLIPSISIIATADFEKLASDDLQSNQIPLQLIIAFNHDINDKYFLAYNLGTSTWLKDLILTAETGMDISDKFSFFLEYYGNYIKAMKPDHNIDCGILYVPKPNLQLDLAAGKSLVEPNGYFVTAGFSYWFKSKPGK